MPVPPASLAAHIVVDAIIIGVCSELSALDRSSLACLSLRVSLNKPVPDDSWPVPHNITFHIITAFYLVFYFFHVAETHSAQLCFVYQPSCSFSHLNLVVYLEHFGLAVSLLYFSAQ